MPELPEVETVRRDLAAAVIGRTIATVEATGVRSVRRYGADALVRGAAGRTVAGVDRRGKFLLLRLAGGRRDPRDPGATLVVHLRMSGQLLLASPTDPPPRHTHVRLRLDDGDSDGDELRFVDPRTFGEVFVSRGREPDVPELAHLGPDPLAPDFTASHLAAALGARRTMLKPLLLDQRRLAGLGNIYTDEVLWAARLRPDRAAGSLEPGEVRRLHASMRRILARAVELRGSSLADLQYRDLRGQIGGYQHDHAVYARTGAPCRRCGTPVVRIRSGGRSTHLCPTCQR